MQRSLTVAALAALLIGCSDPMGAEPVSAEVSGAPAVDRATMAGDVTLSLTSERATVTVHVPAGALDPDVTVRLEAWEDPPDRGALGGPSFRLYPDGAQLRHPAQVTVQWHERPDGPEAPALLWWDPEEARYEPQTILTWDDTTGAATYALSHFSDYTAALKLFVRIDENRLLTPVGNSAMSWEASVRVAPWPGLVQAQLYVTLDGNSVPALVNGGAPLFFYAPDAQVETLKIDIPSVPSIGPVKHILEITADFTYLLPDDAAPVKLEQNVLLWRQRVVTGPAQVPNPASNQKAKHLLHKYAPLLHFDNEETSYPRSVDDILNTGGPVQVLLPSGAIETLPGGAAAAKKRLAVLGHEGATIRFDPGPLTYPEDDPIDFENPNATHPSDPELGTVYGTAIQLLEGRYALLYTMLFPSGRELGLGPKSATGHEGRWWGGIRGQTRTVLVIVNDTSGPNVPDYDLYEIESVTYEDHIKGHSIQYQGTPKQDYVWPFAAASWTSGRSRADLDYVLSCYHVDPAIKYLGEGDCQCSTDPATGVVTCPDFCPQQDAEESEEHPWVFVASKSHAMYPRPGRYVVVPPGGGPPQLPTTAAAEFDEEAGGSTRVWQPPGVAGVCPQKKQYKLEIIEDYAATTSTHENGYLLFGGLWGVGRFATSRFVPYHEAWQDPEAWAANAESSHFWQTATNLIHTGTRCYRCLPDMQATSLGNAGSVLCVKSPPPFPFCISCPACGPLTTQVSMAFDKNLDCNQRVVCPPQPANTPLEEVKQYCVRNGLTYDFAVPLSGELCPQVEGADCDTAPEKCGQCSICQGLIGYQNPEKPWTVPAIVGVYQPPGCGTVTSSACHVNATLTGAPGCTVTDIDYVEATCYGQL